MRYGANYISTSGMIKLICMVNFSWMNFSWDIKRGDNWKINMVISWVSNTTFHIDNLFAVRV
jgi:hypothetical protein